MATLCEGIFPCIVLGATYGGDAVTGVPTVRINIKFSDGPNAGRLATYEDVVNAQSAKFVGWSCKAVGWKAHKTSAASTGAADVFELATLQADCAAWIEKTGGKTDAEIKHIKIGRGKKFDKWLADLAKWTANGSGGDEPQPPIWDKCAGIGRGPKPLTTVRPSDTADANEAMRAAMNDGLEESPF